MWKKYIKYLCLSCYYHCYNKENNNSIIWGDKLLIVSLIAFYLPDNTMIFENIFFLKT